LAVPELGVGELGVEELGVEKAFVIARKTKSATKVRQKYNKSTRRKRRKGECDKKKGKLHINFKQNSFAKRF
jgi:hypothetical protein